MPTRKKMAHMSEVNENFKPLNTQSVSENCEAYLSVNELFIAIAVFCKCDTTYGSPITCA